MDGKKSLTAAQGNPGGNGRSACIQAKKHVTKTEIGRIPVFSFLESKIQVCLNITHFYMKCCIYVTEEEGIPTDLSW